MKEARRELPSYNSKSINDDLHTFFNSIITYHDYNIT